MMRYGINALVDAGQICGLCHEPAIPTYHRHFIDMRGVEKSHNYCSVECKEESYDFQSADQDICD